MATPDPRPEAAQGRGLVRSYLSHLQAGAKGAIGVETAKIGVQVWKGAVRSMQTHACPRCGELSLMKVGHDEWQCDFLPCGMRGTSAEVKNMESTGAAPAVLAIAKGVGVKEISQRIRGSQRASRIAWGAAALIFVYALSWLWEERYAMFVWTGMIGFAIGLQGFRYAFRSWQALNHRRGGLRVFLRTPAAWFI